jgi:phosphoketolase
LIVSSHTWENGKNEQSHQDPTIGEALLGEMSDVSRVLFPVDGNSAMESLRSIYAMHGVIGCLVTPKRAVRNVLSPTQAQESLLRGAVTLAAPASATIQLVAIGAYQLIEVLRAQTRLSQHGITSKITAVIEPGRLREPRDELEARYVLSDQEIEALFPPSLPRLLMTHTRPEAMTGVLRRLDGGRSRFCALGYRNRGGTLDVNGMLFANRCTWAHLVQESVALLGRQRRDVLSGPEQAALDGRGDPRILFQ